MKSIKKLSLLVRIMHQCEPSYGIVLVMSSLFSSIQVIINVILPKYFIEELLGAQNTSRLILLFAITIGSNLFFNVFGRIMKRLIEVRNASIERKIHALMAQKIMKIDYAYLEDPYYLDLKERALFACNNQSAMVNMIRVFARILGRIFSLIGLVAIMLSLSYVLIIILFVGIGISMFINSRFKKYQVEFNDNLIPINRKYGYYLSQTFNFTISKEMRLDAMHHIFLDKVRHFNSKINDEFITYLKKEGKTSGTYRFINAIQTGLVYLYVAFRVFSEEWGPKISLGDFMMVATSAISFTTTFDALSNDVMIVKQMLSYLSPLVEFMDLKESFTKESSIKLQTIETIEVEDVSFRYPKADHDVLRHLTFSLHRGEKISIVGLNGAGKTTLIKLLTRLYQPTSGTIKINGIPINEYEEEDYNKHLSAVFQDYRLFAFSIKENLLGNLPYNEAKANRILEQVGLKEVIAKLPNGIDTVLNKSYDPNGTELSGGQQQKLAIARALYKDADLVILDEPTSALDPLAEAEIYQQFNQLVLNKASIYISHRMSSSVFCDKVLVIDQGIVADFEPHEELMKNHNSLYYRLFTSQAKSYQLNPNDDVDSETTEIG